MNGFEGESLSSLEAQQGLLGGDAADPRKAGHPAAGADHPVAGDDDGKGVAPAGPADGPRRGVQDPRQGAVGGGGAVWYFREARPKGKLERRPGGLQGQVESFQASVEVSVQLVPGLGQQGRRLGIAALSPFDGDKETFLAEQGKRPQGAVHA